MIEPESIISFILFMVGVVVLGISVGTYAQIPQLGWGIIAFGLIAVSMLFYLRPRPPGE